MKVYIDNKSGFCFGVVNAIQIAEQNLDRGKKLFSLGDIVHNGPEIHRLSLKGLATITREEFFKLSNCSVLIRAHGEPPGVYSYAAENNIEIIEATCPVVLRLQKMIKKSYEQGLDKECQLVIFGRKGHAEVIGLNGYTGNNSIIIESKDDLDKINFSKPVILYSQTTRSIEKFQEIAAIIRERTAGNVPVEIRDTICRQVANRVKHLNDFCGKHDVIIFVAGSQSSNGKFLYSVCRKINNRSHIIENKEDIQPEWFRGAVTVGVCGATSTPLWLMEEIAKNIREHY